MLVVTRGWNLTFSSAPTITNLIYSRRQDSNKDEDQSNNQPYQTNHYNDMIMIIIPIMIVMLMIIMIRKNINKNIVTGEDMKTNPNHNNDYLKKTEKHRHHIPNIPSNIILCSRLGLET